MGSGTTLTPIPRMFYSGSGVAADRPAAAGLRNGSLWYSTDTLDIDQVVAGAWVTIFDASVVGAAHAASHQTAGADEINVTDLAGVLADAQNPVAHSHLTITETQVYTGNGAEAWTDLDLSGTIGAQASLVLLKVIVSAIGFVTAFRKNGDADEFYIATRDMGCALVDTNNVAHAVILVATDASGIIEWIVEDNARTYTIDVIGYIT